MFFVISGYCLAAAADSASRKGMKAESFSRADSSHLSTVLDIHDLSSSRRGLFESGYANAWLGMSPSSMTRIIKSIPLGT